MAKDIFEVYKNYFLVLCIFFLPSHLELQTREERLLSAHEHFNYKNKKEKLLIIIMVRLENNIHTNFLEINIMYGHDFFALGCRPFSDSYKQTNKSCSMKD